jgi:glycosyltransferase involved in cell wall biosynthesis
MSLAHVPLGFFEDEDLGGAAETATRRLPSWSLRGIPSPRSQMNAALEQLATGPVATELPSPGSRPTPPRVSVIVPTFNEAKNLPHVLSGIPPDIHEVIVVDGHSVDGTVATARFLRPDVQIVLQNRHGKGNAMACGFAAATGDVIVMLDADGSADPNEIARFVAALTDGADFAKGSRFFQDGGSADITRLRAWGNRWLNRIANFLFGTPYTDLCYGYNAFWRDCLDCLELDPRPGVCGDRQWGDGFEIETIINTRVAKAGLRIAEVPSYEHRRLHGNSNLNTWRDGGRVVRALLVERFNGKGSRPRHRFAGNVVMDTALPGVEQTAVADEPVQEAI